jgi:hypothetical protein
MATQFGRRHLAVHRRDKLDVGGFGEGVPDGVAVIRELKPTLEGVVTTKV